MAASSMYRCAQLCSTSGRQAIAQHGAAKLRTPVDVLQRRLSPPRSGKGFDNSTEQQQAAPEAPSTSSPSSMDSVEALEDRIRGNRKRKIEAKVKVNAPAVDLVTGKTAPTPESEFETKAVTGLFVIFLGIMAEGLLLAASGFLPEEYDDLIAKTLYPAFSPSVLVFLGCSSLYGLWKTGKLPGQRQL